jgi:hypothetical protein
LNLRAGRDIGGDGCDLDAFVQEIRRRTAADFELVVVRLARMVEPDQLPGVVEHRAAGAAIVGVGHVVQKNAVVVHHLVVLKNDLLRAPVGMLDDVGVSARMDHVGRPFELDRTKFGGGRRLDGNEGVVEPVVVRAGQKQLLRNQAILRIGLGLSVRPDEIVELAR